MSLASLLNFAANPHMHKPLQPCACLDKDDHNHRLKPRSFPRTVSGATATSRCARAAAKHMGHTSKTCARQRRAGKGACGMAAHWGRPGLRAGVLPHNPRAQCGCKGAPGAGFSCMHAGGRRTGAVAGAGGGNARAAARARGGRARRVDAGGQLRRDLLLHVVAQHGEDLLHERVQLLLEQQRRVLGLHLRARLGLLRR